MRRAYLLRVSVLLLCASFVVGLRPAEAQGGIGAFTGSLGPSKGQVAAVVVGILAVGAAIGVGTYYVVRKSHTITGCVASGTAGLQLHSESDQAMYVLVGDVAGAKPGERLRVKGKKQKKTKSFAGDRRFVVEKISKDLGPCSASPSTT